MARRTPLLDPSALAAALAGDPGSADADEVDEALLDATRDLLGAYGVRRWSVDDVAARSGLGRSTVYRRFEGRGELLLAALARDGRRFFSAIADAVADVDDLEGKVVEGFLVGLGAARRSVLGRLVESDPATVVPAITAGPVLAAARQALVERFLSMRPGGDAAQAAVVAEALVRLALSFLLMPSSVVDLDDPVAARRALGHMVGALVR